MPNFCPYSASGLIDPFAWTEARNFGAISARRPHTQCFADAGDALTWQKSVYDLALQDHQAAPFDVILDIGCGSGEKSQLRFGDTLGLLQVDRTDARVATVRRAKVAFQAVSLDSWDDLDALFALIDPAKRTLVICANVIERLHDPRPLITFLRRTMLANLGNVCFLSTPDHHRIDGGKDGDLPSNPNHTRQWSVFALGALLRSVGFNVERYGLVEMNANDHLGCTILARLTCAPDDYDRFLAHAGLPAPGPRLLVTCEHKSLGRGGGIGAYAYHSEIALEDRTIVLLYGENGVDNRGDTRADTAAADRQYIHLADMMREPNDDPVYRIHGRTSFQLLDAAQNLFLLYPELRYVEYEDYQGCAHAIAQAKSSALLPSRLRTICYGHGNHHYLEVNNSSFFVDHEIHARERECLERSDFTLIPSNFLSGIYQRAGLKFKKEVRLAYPYQFQRGSSPIHDYQKIRRIVFFGKRTRGKGFHLFGEAINLLANEAALSQVDEIIIAGVGGDHFDFAPAVAAKIRSYLYPADEVVAQLHKQRADTLAVTPYLGDNFPFSIHELLDAGVQTIFAKCGGVPEVLADSDDGDLAGFAPKPIALAARIKEKLAQSGMARGLETVTLRQRFVDLQMHRNVAYQAFSDQIRATGFTPSFLSGSLPSYDVVITFHNEDARLMADALISLSAQRVPPAKVIIVNDASRPEALQAIQSVMADHTGLVLQLVTPDRNLGLADARNFGLKFSDADFVIAHDVDNMLRSDAAEKMLATLIANPGAGAATCHSVMFPDHANWIQNLREPGVFARYEPIGPDLGEFEANTFGDALAMYRRSFLDRVGGWRNSGLEPLEDFELFYALQAEGLNVLVIPSPIAMYRVRPDSMLRTYDRFSGYRRIADVLTRRLGRDGLSIVRHVMQPQQSAAPVSNGLLQATLPLRLRNESKMMQAMQGLSWKKVALRRPFHIRYWQTLRRLQREGKRLGLRP